MSPFKKIIFGVAFVVTGFLAFAGVLAFVLNRDISFFEIVIVFVLLFLPLVITLILYKKQTAKPKI